MDSLKDLKVLELNLLTSLKIIQTSIKKIERKEAKPKKDFSAVLANVAARRAKQYKNIA